MCYRLYAHIIESCAEKRLALCVKALKIFYQSEGASGANTMQVFADITNTWTDVRWFPWEKDNNKGMNQLDRKIMGYGVKWISENLSKEIAMKLLNTYNKKDREILGDVLHSSEPIPPPTR